QDRHAGLAGTAQSPAPARPAGAVLVQAADRGRAVGPRAGADRRRAAVSRFPVVRRNPRLLCHRAAVDPVAAAAVGEGAGMAALGQPAAGDLAVVVAARERRFRRRTAAAGDLRRTPGLLHLGPAVAAAAGAGRPADRRTAAALPRRWRAAPAAGRRDRTGRLPVAGVVRAAGRRPAGRTGGHRPQRRQASARPAVLAVQRRRCAGPARSVRRRRQHAGARAASDHRGRNRRTDGLHRAYQRDLPAAAQYAGLVPDGAVHAGAGDLAGAGGRDRAVDRDLAEAATAMAQACTAANGRCRVAVMFSGDGGPSLQTPAAMKPYLSIALVAAFAIGEPPARAQPRQPPASQTVAVPGWTGALQSWLEAVDARHRGDIGVYVRHLDRDESVSHRADEPWYLASG